MQRDRLNRLIQRTMDPAFALTARAEIWAWNPAAEAITGFRPSEALHESFPRLTEAHGPLGKPLDAEYCERAIRDGGVSSFDLELKTATGAVIWLNVSVLVFEPLRSSPASACRCHAASRSRAARRPPRVRWRSPLSAWMLPARFR